MLVIRTSLKYRRILSYSPETLLANQPTILVLESQFDIINNIETIPEKALLKSKSPMPVILIACNDPLVRDCLAHPLIELGYLVQVTADGISAYEVAMKLAPDIVISQMEMPGLDGLTLCQQLKSNIAIPTCHFILITDKDADIVDIGRVTEPDDYLVQPIAIFELTSRIRTGVRALNWLRLSKHDASHIHCQQKASLLPMTSKEQQPYSSMI